MSYHLDRETGEVIEGTGIDALEVHAEVPQTISERASKGVKRPGYWDKQEGVMKSNSSRRFNVALFRAQSEIDAMIDADAANPFTKKNYTSLGMLLSKIRPVLKRHQLIIKQGAGKLYAHKGDGKDQKYFQPVFMEIVHAHSGQSERQMVEMPLTKLDPQAIGIAITYGRRYLIMSYFGIASVDDDAASAVQKRLDKDEQAEAVSDILEKIKACEAEKDLKAYAKELMQALGNFSDENVDKLRKAYEKRLHDIRDEKPEEQPADAK